MPLLTLAQKIVDAEIVGEVEISLMFLDTFPNLTTPLFGGCEFLNILKPRDGKLLFNNPVFNEFSGKKNRGFDQKKHVLTHYFGCVLWALNMNFSVIEQKKNIPSSQRRGIFYFLLARHPPHQN